MRAVLDVNVIISAVLSPRGFPAKVFRAWLDGAFELVVSPMLLAELERALTYPKLRQHVTREEARELIDLLSGEAVVRDDPPAARAFRSGDPDDDYLISLAEDSRALLVSGDAHLLQLRDQLPVLTAVEFLAQLPAP